MKGYDLFDKIHVLLLGLVLLLLAALIATGGNRSTVREGMNRAVERELATQARLAFLQKVYSPVEDLTSRGELQSALLKLDELGRLYPGEAHGRILQGEVMHRLGALDMAVAGYAAGVRLNGEYLDKQSPLSRRTDIVRLVEEGRRDLLPRAQANRMNASLQKAVQELHYLQSRLAGGCE